MNLQMVNTILSRVGEKKRVSDLPFGGWRYRLASYGSDCAYTYETDWQPLDENTVLPSDRTVFAECEVAFPPEILCGEDGWRDYLFLRFGGMEGYVTVDGEIYQGHDGSRDRFPLRPEWAGQTKTVGVMAFTRSRGRHFLEYSSFGRIDLRAEDLEFAMRLAWDFYNLDAGRGENDTRILRERVLGALRRAMLGMDVDAEGEAFRAECARAARTLDEALSEIDDGDVRGSVSFVGHTHIDVAWLWQLKDTVRKCAHTFSNVLRLMDEYPSFRFSCSQMQLLWYAKEHFPDLYRQIRGRIAEGRFEPLGAMWVESDCNVISGESLVRQILFGVGFSEREFGVRSEIAWLPDTFGFQPNMPQILKKTGTKYFYSNKIHWQGQNRFPYTSFRWKGIDGSEVLASIPRTAGFYNGSPEPDQIRFAQDMNLQAGAEDEIILPVGHGDGGGGPTREMICKAEHLRNFPGLPRAKVESAAEFFRRLEGRSASLPVWYGDLYIETHRGTLSSVGRVKKNNRRAEQLYQAAEKLGVAAQAAGLRPDWKLLTEGWREILLLQFHDILPGSSVDPVYDEDCADGYRRIFGRSDRFLAGLFDGLCGPAEGAWVYNPLSFPRTAVAEIECPDARKTCVRAPSGEALPTEVFEKNGARFLRFLAKDVPPLAAAVYTFSEDAAPRGGMDVRQSAEGVEVENPGFLLRFDAEGRLVRIFDKAADREVVSGPAGELRIFRDGPQREDAWNLYPEYREREIADYPFVRSIELVENNAVRTVLLRRLSAEKCDITQRIVLYPHTARIDFETHAEWNEVHKVLRAYVPCALRAPFAALEEGFGTYLRPTVASTPFELSRFEVCAHRFIDLSDGAYGVSLLNDCKYGHDVQDNVLGVTLLRSTTHPAKHADIGAHDFTYSIYPHAGDRREGLTVREGLDLNAPLFVRPGSRPLAAPAFCGARDLIIDSVKPAEDGRGFILRLYECNGCSGSGELALPAAARVTECDLLEKPAAPPEETDRVRIRYGPYEIRTFRVESL